MKSKIVLIAVTWGFAFFLSWGLRFWGQQHPNLFVARPFVVVSLLFVPSLLLGLWLFQMQILNDKPNDFD